MNRLVQDYPHSFIEISDPPCISLYQPTHRSHPENAQDPIRFKNLLKRIEKALMQDYPEAAKALLKPFHALAEDFEFWTHNSLGLAVFANQSLFKVYQLQRPVNEFTLVSDSFHIKPLIRIMQSADRYQILGLSRDKVKLFEGNRDYLEEIELHSSIPRTLVEALGEETSSPQLSIASKGPTGNAIFHGHGGHKDDTAIDTERFFRIVDEGIYKLHSHPENLPLILASLPEYHHVFHRISHNPGLLAESLSFFPENMSLDSLRQKAWSLLEPFYLARLQKLIQNYEEAKAKSMASDDLNIIAEAAFNGKINTLMIDADQQIPGRIDPVKAILETNESMNPEVDDILDELSKLVLKKKGEVIIVPGDKMPVTTGAAAIYRY